MFSRARDIAIVVAILVASIFVFDRCRNSRVSEWETRARAAEVLNETLSARVDTLRTEADSLRSQAAEVVEVVVVERAPVTDSMVASLPPAVTVGEQERDVVIERLTGERDDAVKAYVDLDEAYGKLELALDTMTEARDSLLVVVEDRPGPRPWYIPTITLGASAVIDDGALAFKVPAVTLGWKIGL